MSDMSGNVCVVTGASSGIGKVTARRLAEKGASVVLVCRNREKGEAAAEEIKRSTGNENLKLEFRDLSSQREVIALAREVRCTYPKIDVLINNAAKFPAGFQETEDGIESTFALNHLAPFFLSILLLEPLSRAHTGEGNTESASSERRIITVSSVAQKAGTVKWGDLEHREGEFKPWPVYAQSKLLNVIFTKELARRLKDPKTKGPAVTANCLHPGTVYTDIFREFNPIRKLASRFISVGPEKGADNSVYVATSPEVRGLSGCYFVKRKPAEVNPEAEDPEAGKRLWEKSLEMTVERHRNEIEDLLPEGL